MKMKIVWIRPWE